jgi:hypothetical protein
MRDVLVGPVDFLWRLYDRVAMVDASTTRLLKALRGQRWTKRAG